jgi:hypothetical protein
MECVAQDDLGAEFDQFAGRHRLHGAVGADGHEHRSLDDAVCQFQPAAAGGARRSDDGKAHGGLRDASRELREPWPASG